MRTLHDQRGTTLLETVIALGLGGLLVSALAATISLVLWLPGERRDRVTVAEDLMFAQHWIAQDANAAESFTAGTSPVYGAFSWSDYTAVSLVSRVVTYSYDAANGYLMRTEAQNGTISTTTLAVARNIARADDVVFVWSPSSYSVQVALTSTIDTATLGEGITATVKNATVVMAARPRAEPPTSPPGIVVLPTPVPGSATYSVDGNPVLTTGTYLSGGATELQSIDSAYYVADSSVGADKQVVYEVRSQSLTAPTTISQIEVRYTARANKTGVAVEFYIKDSSAGFPASAESGFTFTTANEDRTEYFYISSAALSYINSLPDRRVDLRIRTTTTAAFTLSTEQIIFVASP